VGVYRHENKTKTFCPRVNRPIGVSVMSVAQPIGAHGRAKWELVNTSTKLNAKHC